MSEDQQVEDDEQLMQEVEDGQYFQFEEHENEGRRDFLQSISSLSTSPENPTLPVDWPHSFPSTGGVNNRRSRLGRLSYTYFHSITVAGHFRFSLVDQSKDARLREDLLAVD
ncbi:hypothetical protein L1887_01248 [Cichorium endivia]|nr:hypothetical protein L1887_01248 [Cichorium endivia]